MGKLRVVLIILIIVSILWANPETTVKSQLSNLCIQMKTIIPILGVLSLLCGAVVFAGGQVLGAEARAKMNVWATALVTAGIIGIAIGVLAPHVFMFIARAGGGLAFSGAGFPFCGGIDYTP